MLVIKATLDQFDEEVIARVTKELRRITGDMTLKITNLKKGSVKVTLDLSNEAAAILAELRSRGELTQLCGFDVSDLTRDDLRAPRSLPSLPSRSTARTYRGATRGYSSLDSHAATLHSPISIMHIAIDPHAELKSQISQLAPSLRRIAERLCMDSTQADDLVQDTITYALQRDLPLNIRPISWLITSLYQIFIDNCRNSRRYPKFEPFDEDRHSDNASSRRDDVVSPIPHSHDPNWQNVTTDDIWTALEEISPALREVYVLHSFEHLSYEEIATRLQISTVTVGTRLTRVRKRLRRALVKKASHNPDSSG